MGYPKNEKQLKDTLLKKYISFALKKTQQEIYEAIQESITEYYKEYSPQFYERKYKFLNSLIKTKIVMHDNSVSCEVKISEDYLRYSYTGNSEDRITGQDVVLWANREIPGAGNHGGTVDAGRDDGFFEVGLRDLGGDTGILALLTNNLKRRGLKVAMS